MHDQVDETAASAMRSEATTLPDWLVQVGIFLLALVPRGWFTGTVVTIDEQYEWFGDAEKMLAAVRSQHWEQTIIVGHPGVTTLWLGGIGAAMHRGLAKLGLVSLRDPLVHRELLRLPVAGVTALCIALSVPLLCRLLGRRVAWLAALVLATDPFLVAHGQLLHIDALLTAFINLSILQALVAFRLDEGVTGQARPVRWGMLAASGVTAGLALLSKTPALILVPMVGLIGLIGGWRAPRLSRRVPLAAWLMWGMVALATWFVLWPAAWVSVPHVLSTMYHEMRDNGGSAHHWGNFFLGHADAAPGWLFYPVAVAMRLTQWTLVGVAGLVFAAVRRRTPLPSMRVVVVLLVFVLAFAGIMSAFPKKFDRYVLPVVPAIGVLAAVGLLSLLDWLPRWLPLFGGKGHLRGGWLPWALTLGLFVSTLVWYQPYELAYYNPLLGGGPVAAKTVPVGWGEGLDEAGAFIAAQGTGCDVPVASPFQAVLARYVCNKVVILWEATQPTYRGYVVLYTNQTQAGNTPELTARLLGKERPLHVVRIHGVDLAFVYFLGA
ncbi:MAG: hypothetical protein NVS4B8_23420 [Herpetosiphon sp.]